VTSVVMSNCGFTLAPCKPADRDWYANCLSYVEDIPVAAMAAGIDWTWETFAEYLDALDGRLAINVAALVGHSALRYYVMGRESYERAATADEIRAMQDLLRASIRAGAIGLSTSRLFFHVGEGGRPIPSRLADDDELIALCDVMGELGAGLLETDGGRRLEEYADQIRDLSGPIALRTGRPVLLGNTVQRWNAPTAWRDVYDRIAEFQRRGARIFTQVTPVRLDLRFTLEGTAIFEDLPSWHDVMALPRDDRIAAFRDAAVRDALQFEAVDDVRPCFFSRRWDTVFVDAVASPRNHGVVGRSISEIAQEQGRREIDVLLDLALDEDLAVDFLIVGTINGDDEAVATMLRSPQSIIGSSDAGAHVRTMCGAGDTSLLLSRWVRERGVLTLEQAVHAITFNIASVLGLRRRGLLREGWAGDIVVFDPDTIDHLPTRLVADLPGAGERLWRDPQGIHTVVVNGHIAIDHTGRDTGARTGRVLRHRDLR
jgi:N-acyl-D-aspartate/D-glutamate deacylase